MTARPAHTHRLPPIAPTVLPARVPASRPPAAADILAPPDDGRAPSRPGLQPIVEVAVAVLAVLVALVLFSMLLQATGVAGPGI